MDLYEKILEKSINAVPALKYALGVAGIVASIAIISSLRLDLRVAVFGTVVMLVLMVALFVFSKLIKIKNKYVLYPAILMLWSFVGLTIFTAVLLFSSVFFNYPINLKSMLAEAAQDDTSIVKGEYLCKTAVGALDNCRIEQGSTLTIYFESPSIDNARFPHFGELSCTNNECISNIETLKCLGCKVPNYNQKEELQSDGVLYLSRESSQGGNGWSGSWKKYGISTSFYLAKK